MWQKCVNTVFRKMPVSYSSMKYLKQVKESRNFSSEKPAIILGIETSCDDTGCAIVNSDGEILGEALHSQQLVHLNHGGIIPHIAQAFHRDHITDVVQNSLKAANLKLRDVDAIATTMKPGLELSLVVGMKFGKYLSRIGNKPFIPIHHMEAHALTARMVEKVDLPYLVLLISGGHCILAIVQSIDKFYLLGTSLDDAPGEAFDKTARRMKLRNIPEFFHLSGGAAIELAATKATDPEQFLFTIPMMQYRDCNFSVAGIKNCVMRHILFQERKYNIRGDELIPDIYNLCAAFQLAMAKHLCHRTQRAIEFVEKLGLFPEGRKTLVVSGGAACNNFITKCLGIVCSESGYKFVRPPPKLCTDNGVMIAWNGVERWIANAGVLTDREEIENLDVEHKCFLGEDWREKVLNENIKCKWIKIKKAYAA